MTKHLTLACLAAVAIFNARAQSCLLPGATKLPPSTQVALGPTAYAALQTDGVLEAIINARDAWDNSDAADRIGDWSGVITNLDCPMGQPLQIGAFNFTSEACTTVSAYGSLQSLAFVDYYSDRCVGCGTKSISINLAYSWSVAAAPLPGEYDLQSVLAHEFGHLLGLAHLKSDGTCGVDDYPNTCAWNSNIPTLISKIYSGAYETCQRTLSTYDIQSANGFYP